MVSTEKHEITFSGWMSRARMLRHTRLSEESYETQNAIICAAFFPKPSRAQQVIARLYEQAAMCEEGAVMCRRSRTVQKLLKQGQVLSTRSGKVYLSEEGVTVAAGTLDIYPEIQRVSGQCVS